MRSLSGDIGAGAGDAVPDLGRPDVPDLGRPGISEPGRAESSEPGRDESSEPGRPGMTVSQLAERSGVGVPSIHHYRRLGLLPPPVMVSANRFHYDERHVEALRMIRLLRERRALPLAAIRQVLPDLLAGIDSEAFDGRMWDAVMAVPDVEDEEHHEVRRRLLETARSAFVEHGYGGVNVEQLCQQTGIAKGSFYRHFESKDALYEAAARSTVDVVGASIARWRRTMTAEGAVDAVSGALEPLVPLLLEVVVRAAHGDLTLDGVVPEVVAGIAELVAPHLEPGTAPAVRGASPPTDSGAGFHGTDADVAFTIAERALLLLLRRAMGLGDRY